MRDWRKATVDRVAEVVLWTFRLIKGWLPRALGGAGSLSFVIWGVNGGTAWTTGIGWFVLGAAFTVAAFVAEFVVQRPSYMQLSQMREDAERKEAAKSAALESAVRILLVRLGEHCKLDGHSDRLSVYAFHEDKFFMVARHSGNPTFAARRRDLYPADEGAIGKAWASDHGQALVTMPAANQSWIKSAQRQGINDEAIAGMKMRSLGLAGYRLAAASQSVGVLMIESTTHGRIKQDHLDIVSQSLVVAAIAELVAAFALMTPAGETFAATNGAKTPRKWQVVAPKTS